MTFIALVLALLLDRQLKDVERWRRWDWLPGAAAWVEDHLPEHPVWHGRAGLVLYLLPLVLAVLVVQWTLPGPLALLFATVVFLYCLGPIRLERELYREADAETLAAEADIGAGARRLDPFAGPEFNPAAAPAVAAHDRLFGVVFWFVLLGPAGAVLFRVTAELRREAEGEGPLAQWALRRPVRVLYMLLAWLPVRLTVLSYGLAGNFAALWHAWTEKRFDATGDPEPVLRLAGRLALSEAEGTKPPSADAGCEMVQRALWIWVFFIAAGTLGWLLGL